MTSQLAIRAVESLSATLPVTAPVTAQPLSLSEIRDLDVPLKLAILLIDKDRYTQVRLLRHLAGFPVRVTTPVGFNVRLDRQDTVLSIERC
jgi:hypothetical protein